MNVFLFVLQEMYISAKAGIIDRYPQHQKCAHAKHQVSDKGL